ncbi:hypothetical protein [Oscillatoria salina]|uniref:hypothetical protein n=1 Tax=Oscillatoria salina TaxID=331517 RepID=UPI001CCBA1C9|nr:hypothetical protein [Oscillatoria salina]MBZ8181180.1 hypothetical protein [Oscillatoria salina IIICB1]
MPLPDPFPTKITPIGKPTDPSVVVKQPTLLTVAIAITNLPYRKISQRSLNVFFL